MLQLNDSERCSCANEAAMQAYEGLRNHQSKHVQHNAAASARQDAMPWRTKPCCRQSRQTHTFAPAFQQCSVWPLKLQDQTSRIQPLLPAILMWHSSTTWRRCWDWLASQVCSSQGRSCARVPAAYPSACSAHSIERAVLIEARAGTAHDIIRHMI